jgi:hypothetical protein
MEADCGDKINLYGEKFPNQKIPRLPDGNLIYVPE